MISLSIRVVLIAALPVILILPTDALGQLITQRKPSRVPIYRSANDSLSIARIDQLIEQASLDPTTPPYIIDSLSAKYEKATQQGIVRYRNVYYASDAMTPLDSLAGRKISVR